MIGKYLRCWNPWKGFKKDQFKRIGSSMLIVTGGLMILDKIKIVKNNEDANKDMDQVKQIKMIEREIEPVYKVKVLTFGERVKKIMRMVQLFVIFLPSIIMFPLMFVKLTENIFYDVFVWSVEKAGVVWIKCFQYLSHRRDIIGQKMASKFLHLRENSPAHSYSDTQSIIQQQFGTTIGQMFQSFDPNPIGVGSIGQVYNAVFNNRKVAVKIRHPNASKNIQRDIDIIFTMSRILSKISSFFEAPITSQSLKKLLINQIDFNIQAQNLLKFSRQFKQNSSVKFPEPIISRQSVLIQQFIDSLPISHYMQKTTPFNKQIAQNGASIFFQMLMTHNFIHADLHAGNIYVGLKDLQKEQTNWFKNQFRKIIEWCESTYVEYFQKNEIIKQLYFENLKEANDVKQIQKKYGQKVEIALIDVGMVTALKNSEKETFRTFILSVVSKKPLVCANMIYNLSMFKGQMIKNLPQTKQLNKYKDKLFQLFSQLSKLKIKDLQGLKLLKGMLDVIREHKMSLQGQFATLLTNILIIEQIGKDINPSINILKCTVPYFKTHLL